MQPEDRRIYQIPRKVDAGFKFFGLTAMGLFLMIIPVGLSIVAWLLPLEFMGKVAITIFLVYGFYLMLTIDLNGLTGFQFLWLLLQHTDSQKIYNLTSSIDSNSADKPLIRRLPHKKEVEEESDAGS